MKIKVLANELIETEINAVSLVKNGANRSPFKVIKSDDEIETISLGQKIQKMFEPKKPTEVVAFFIRKGEEAKYLPALEKAGFAVNCTEEDGVMLVKQAGYVEGEFGNLFQINKDMGFAINKDVLGLKSRLIKDFYGGLREASEDFDENLSANSFYPGLDSAISALRSTLYACMCEAETPSDAASKASTALNSFHTYVAALVGGLPESVFKMDFSDIGSLPKNIGSSNLDSSTVETGSGETIMAKTGLKEAAAGDLDGLDKEVVKTAEPAAKTVEAGTETVVQAAAVEKTAEAAAPVVEAAAAAVAPALDPNIAALVASIATLTDSFKKSEETIASLQAKLAETETLAKAAQELAAGAKKLTVVKDEGNIDMSLATLGSSRKERMVAKSEEEVWAGILPGIDSFGRRR